MEIFKPIKDFEEEYEVSNEGNVKSHITNRILRKGITNKRYYQVNLRKDGKSYKKFIHRLVAETFIPNSDNLPQVNHKDENKFNNFVWVNEDGSVDLEKSNLEWCTAKYNINYGTGIERSATKRRGRKFSEEHKRKLSESHTNNPLKNKPVVAVKDGEVVMEFASIKEAIHNGFNHVSKCCLKKRKTCGGYEWFYKSDWLKMQATQSNERVACDRLEFK